MDLPRKPCSAHSFGYFFLAQRDGPKVSAQVADKAVTLRLRHDCGRFIRLAALFKLLVSAKLPTGWHGSYYPPSPVL